MNIEERAKGDRCSIWKPRRSDVDSVLDKYLANAVDTSRRIRSATSAGDFQFDERSQGAEYGRSAYAPRINEIGYARVITSRNKRPFRDNLS